MNRSAVIIMRLINASFPDGPAGAFADRLSLWHRRHRTRQQLRRLDDARLSDLGLSRAGRRAECQKWFWQP